MNGIIFLVNGSYHLIDNSYFSITYGYVTQSTNSVYNAVHKLNFKDKHGSFMKQSSLCIIFEHCVARISITQNIR